MDVDYVDAHYCRAFLSSFTGACETRLPLTILNFEKLASPCSILEVVPILLTSLNLDQFVA